MKKLPTLLLMAILATSLLACSTVKKLTGQRDDSILPGSREEILTPEQFNVLRKHGTERAGTSILDKEYGKGQFVCAGCDLPLFVSDTKFNSGTGWPSFNDPIPDAIETSVDKSFFSTRTEVHCRRCGGHLGHVFEDGPKPTGLRYCMNGISMKFIAA